VLSPDFDSCLEIRPKLLHNVLMSLLRWYCSRLKPPSEAARQHWQKTKARGKNSFALRVGVLQWGGLMFVVTTAQDLIRKPRFSHQPIYYVADIAVNLLIWPIAGFFFGARLWKFYEMYFGERNQQRPPHSAT
jgi:hypothetical protein